MSDISALQAVNAYTKATDQATKLTASERGSVGGADFQNMVKVNFNKFAKMSPDEIIRQVSSANNISQAATTAGTSVSNVGKSALSDLREALRKQETTTQKVVTGDASTLDLVTSTTEAQNTLQVMTGIRDKVAEGFNQLLNMSI